MHQGERRVPRLLVFSQIDVGGMKISNAKIERFREDHGFAGWLATTASRECLRILRQQQQHTAPPHAAIEQLADPSVGPEQHAIDADTARLLWSLIATLSPRRQKLLRELFFDSPRPYAEVARNTGIPAGGIGPTRADLLVKEAGLSPDMRAQDLTEEQLNKILHIITEHKWVLEGDLRREIASNLKRLQAINCYRGIRHRRGLPVRGQRTSTNARTRKGPRKTVGVTKAKEAATAA